MTKENKLGIWMDHSMAFLTEFTVDPMTTTKFEDKFNHVEKVEAFKKSEILMHHKEQHEQADYYKKLGEIILNYTDVLLFGPTSAKQELSNILKSNHHFDKIKIDVKPADKMTEKEQQLFVKNYFHLNQ